MNEEIKKEFLPMVSGVSNQRDIDIIMSARKAVVSTISAMCHLELQEKPKIESSPVIQWQGKMRVLKPLDCVFVSVITYRHDALKLKKFECNGIVILYVPEDTAVTMLRSFGFVGIPEVEDILDGCGEFLNVMAGTLKTELIKRGYDDFNLSSPHTFGSQIDELFDFYGKEKFELTFTVEGSLFLQLDVGFNRLPGEENKSLEGRK